MPFQAPILDNADPLFALVIITLGFYLHHVEVADHNQASSSLYAEQSGIIIIFIKDRTD